MTKSQKPCEQEWSKIDHDVLDTYHYDTSLVAHSDYTHYVVSARVSKLYLADGSADIIYNNYYSTVSEASREFRNIVASLAGDCSTDDLVWPCQITIYLIRADFVYEQDGLEGWHECSGRKLLGRPHVSYRNLDYL